jgi:hypothetical protein
VSSPSCSRSTGWEDIDLAAEHPTLTICGTMIYVKGKGFFRQEWPKTAAGYRTVVLPRFAVAMLLARKITAVDNLTTRSSPRGAAPDCRRRTSAANGAKPAPTPASNGSPRTPPARPSPASSTRKPTPKRGRPTRPRRRIDHQEALHRQADRRPDSSHILEKLAPRQATHDPGKQQAA